MTSLVTDTAKLKCIAEKININTAEGKAEAADIIAKITKILEENTDIRALAAPQIGINKRVFCINFNGTIKAFVDPIVIKKTEIAPTIETFDSAPGKEYLVMRPTDIKVIYCKNDLTYEDNKFTGAAAVIVDQLAQLLDGVVPGDIGLESDIEHDGPLSELSEDEFQEAIDMLKQITKIRLQKAEEEIKSNDEANTAYDHLRFAEHVIDGTTVVVNEGPKLNREQRRALVKKNKAKKTKASGKNGTKKRR